jgi:hypothetical protein
MIRHLRTVLAIAVGVVVAGMLWYGGLVVVVLVTIGIPLGSQPRPVTPTEYAVMLVLAAAAAGIGARTAASIARQSSRTAVAAVSLVLAVAMLWGFSGRNAWPDWWGPAMAAVMVVGAWVGGTWRQKPGVPRRI